MGIELLLLRLPLSLPALCIAFFPPDFLKDWLSSLAAARHALSFQPELLMAALFGSTITPLEANGKIK
jgi:hypothetical protein